MTDNCITLNVKNKMTLDLCLNEFFFSLFWVQTNKMLYLLNITKVGFFKNQQMTTSKVEDNQQCEENDLLNVVLQ
jgi:hypothetical protein